MRVEWRRLGRLLSWRKGRRGILENETKKRDGCVNTYVEVGPSDASAAIYTENEQLIVFSGKQRRV